MKKAAAGAGSAAKGGGKAAAQGAAAPGKAAAKAGKRAGAEAARRVETETPRERKNRIARQRRARSRAMKKAREQEKEAAERAQDAAMMAPPIQYDPDPSMDGREMWGFVTGRDPDAEPAGARRGTWTEFVTGRGSGGRRAGEEPADDPMAVADPFGLTGRSAEDREAGDDGWDTSLLFGDGD